jgi:hypothetical protein
VNRKYLGGAAPVSGLFVPQPDTPKFPTEFLRLTPPTSSVDATPSLWSSSRFVLLWSINPTKLARSPVLGKWAVVGYVTIDLRLIPSDQPEVSTRRIVTSGLPTRPEPYLFLLTTPFAGCRLRIHGLSVAFASLAVGEVLEALAWGGRGSVKAFEKITVVCVDSARGTRQNTPQHSLQIGLCPRGSPATYVEGI